MKPMIEISSRAARPNACVLSVLLILAAACSGGRSALSTEPLSGSTNSTSTSEKSDLPACGSMTKPCDPNNLGGATCESLGAGSGTLLCDPVTCSYDRSMCSTATTGGGGLGALLGQFARNQGGRGGATAQGMGGRGGRGAMGNSGRGGSSEGQRQDDQEAAEGGRGGDQSQDERDDQDDQSDDGEAGSGGEGGQSSDAGSSTAGAGGEGGGQAGAAGEASANAGSGGEAGAPASAPEMSQPM